MTDRCSGVQDHMEFRWGYYNDPHDRQCLNAFVREVFGGLDFTAWNKLGYAFTEYTPFSYFMNGRVAANVSASAMNLVIAGREINALQVGTVGTLPAYRGRGFIRELMREVHSRTDASHRFSFLFTNDSAAQFYQQFGYRRVMEYSYSAQAPQYKPPSAPARRLDLTAVADRDLLHRLAERRAPVSQRLGVHRQSWLLLFHAVTAYPDMLLYIEPLDAAVISIIAGGALRIVDVIGEHIPTLPQLYPFIGGPNVTKVEFLFEPDIMDVKDVTARTAEDSLTFVRGAFPLENEPFAFPETSRA